MYISAYIHRDIERDAGGTDYMRSGDLQTSVTQIRPRRVGGPRFISLSVGASWKSCPCPSDRLPGLGELYQP